VKVSEILNIAFDMSAWEIWGALCNGGSLVIRGKYITQMVAKADVVIAALTKAMLEVSCERRKRYFEGRGWLRGHLG
jgi:non-ribosomal peptide synthetase component F